MNDEYSLKPALWLGLLAMSLTAMVVLWMIGVPPDGFALFSFMIALLGWRQCVERHGEPSSLQRRLKPWFMGIGAALLLLVIPAGIREFREGGGLTRALWRVGTEYFGKKPPLNIRTTIREETAGKEKTQYLLITNWSSEGVAPRKATFTRQKKSAALELPPVIKPYETVEVRLHDRGAKLFLETGDELEIECEGYSNTWYGRW